MLCLVNAGSHGQRTTLVHNIEGVSNDGTTRIRRALIELKSKPIRRVKSAIFKLVDTVERGNAYLSGQLNIIEGSRQSLEDLACDCDGSHIGPYIQAKNDYRIEPNYLRSEHVTIYDWALQDEARARHVLRKEQERR